MTMWRPQTGIRVIAIGLHWRAGRLLAVEVRDDAGRLKGVRPPGGGVNFGESWRDALMREFREEFAIAVSIEGTPLVIENIYVHEGAPGHEIVFIADVACTETAFGDRERIDFREDSGMPCVARWFDLSELDRDDGPALYPTGLRSLLLSRSRPA